jgi:hypothetical protein
VQKPKCITSSSDEENSVTESDKSAELERSSGSALSNKCFEDPDGESPDAKFDIPIYGPIPKYRPTLEMEDVETD